MLNQDECVMIGDEISTEYLRNIAALARLVTYARQNAQDLQLEFPRHCLDMALGALAEQLQALECVAMAPSASPQAGHFRQ